MAIRKAVISAVNDDGSFSVIHYGPTLLEKIDSSNFIGRDGEKPVVGLECTLEYKNGMFAIVPKLQTP